MSKPAMRYCPECGSLLEDADLLLRLKDRPYGGQLPGNYFCPYCPDDRNPELLGRFFWEHQLEPRNDPPNSSSAASADLAAALARAERAEGMRGFVESLAAEDCWTMITAEETCQEAQRRGDKWMAVPGKLCAPCRARAALAAAAPLADPAAGGEQGP